MSDPTPVRIDVVSDVVCPWCFIGKRRLEKALALKPDIPVEVHWHPYFLNDWIPREGISRDEYLTTKFGSPERYNGIAQRVGGGGRGRRPRLCDRQDQPPAQHARLPPADPLGRRHRQGGRDEAAADGPLFHRRRRSHQPRGAGAGGRRCRPRSPRTCARRSPAIRTSRQSSRKRSRPRRPASRACPASSSAASSRCPARRRRNISPRRSSALAQATDEAAE